jgi:hypothetical protein
MSEEPAKPRKPQRSQPVARARPQAPPEPSERYGIVTFERHLKDDGRTLILYARDAQGSR